jgi:hypothetical protein
MVIVWLFVATLAWGAGHPTLRWVSATSVAGYDLELGLAFFGVIALGAAIRCVAIGRDAAARAALAVALLTFGCWTAVVAYALTTVLLILLIGLAVWGIPEIAGPVLEGMTGRRVPSLVGRKPSKAVRASAMPSAGGRKHVVSAVLICIVSAIAAGVGFEIFVEHVVRRLGDACPWGDSRVDGHPVRVAAAIAFGAGLVALVGMLVRRTNIPWWALLAAATVTVGVASAFAGLGWFFIGNCFG